MQDNAPPHAEKSIYKELEEHYGDHIISRFFSFFMISAIFRSHSYGFLVSRVSMCNPQTFKDLKKSINKRQIANIPDSFLCSVLFLNVSHMQSVFACDAIYVENVFFCPIFVVISYWCLVSIICSIPPHCMKTSFCTCITRLFLGV